LFNCVLLVLLQADLILFHSKLFLLFLLLLLFNFFLEHYI
jgi:hypothetical protein